MYIHSHNRLLENNFKQKVQHISLSHKDKILNELQKYCYNIGHVICMNIWISEICFKVSETLLVSKLYFVRHIFQALIITVG